MLNCTAYCEGLDARRKDEDSGELTDNPYTRGTDAFRDWYRGYNRESAGKETVAKMGRLCETPHGLPCCTHIRVLSGLVSACEVCAPHIPRFRSLYKMQKVEGGFWIGQEWAQFQRDEIMAAIKARIDAHPTSRRTAEPDSLNPKPE